jgi:hypothetical protein
MRKFELNLSDVAKVVLPDSNRIPLEENKDRLIRVAFDLFRLKGDNTEDLWQVQADDDGNEFLVRTYSLPEDDQQVVQASDWNVISDAKGNNLTVLYKNSPIHRLATSMVGAKTAEDVELFRKTIQQKLSSDSAFVVKFISSLPEEKHELFSIAGDPRGIGRTLREETKARKKKKTEVQRDIAKILQDLAKNSKEQKASDKFDLSDILVPDSDIPESGKQIEEDLQSMSTEQREALELALEDMSPDIMTSAKTSKTRFILSKRAAVEEDPLLQKLETVNKMLGDTLSKEDEEEI